jgi:hypothetical protein
MKTFETDLFELSDDVAPPWSFARDDISFSIDSSLLTTLTTFDGTSLLSEESDMPVLMLKLNELFDGCFVNRFERRAMGKWEDIMSIKDKTKKCRKIDAHYHSVKQDHHPEQKGYFLHCQRFPLWVERCDEGSEVSLQPDTERVACKMMPKIPLNDQKILPGRPLQLLSTPSL